MGSRFYNYDEPVRRVLTTAPRNVRNRWAAATAAPLRDPQIAADFAAAVPSLLREAQTCGAEGVQELVLIAQDTTAYGRTGRTHPLHVF